MLLHAQVPLYMYFVYSHSLFSRSCWVHQFAMAHDNVSIIVHPAHSSELMQLDAPTASNHFIFDQSKNLTLRSSPEPRLWHQRLFWHLLPNMFQYVLSYHNVDS